MPIIRIDWDNDKITESKVTELSIAAKTIVAEVTGIGDVFVYANSSQIKIDIAPIEIFIEMSANKIENVEELIRKIKDKLGKWKHENNFNYPINLTLIPMNWKIEINI